MGDSIIAGVGTGGTITGIGDALKKRKPSVEVIALEPTQSPVQIQELDLRLAADLQSGIEIKRSLQEVYQGGNVGRKGGFIREGVSKRSFVSFFNTLV